jgi:small subunit ribosomal protein S17
MAEKKQVKKTTSAKTVAPKAEKAVKVTVAPEAKIAKTIIRKKFSGVVVSDKSDKTIVVKVETVKIHPKYKKRYTVSRKYKVHDEKNEFKAGDKVVFVECRPMSRDKRWRVVK